MVALSSADVRIHVGTDGRWPWSPSYRLCATVCRSGHGNTTVEAVPFGGIGGALSTSAHSERACADRTGGEAASSPGGGVLVKAHDPRKISRVATMTSSAVK